MRRERIFKIKEYGRQELASLYCPRLQPASAWKKMKQWIDDYPGLWEELRRQGYDERRRSFSPPQVRTIVRFMGEP